MYLLRTTFQSPDGYDTKEEEYASNEDWTALKLKRIIKRWCSILNIPHIEHQSRDLLEQVGLSIDVYKRMPK
jgi:hypothetical protein